MGKLPVIQLAAVQFPRITAISCITPMTNINYLLIYHAHRCTAILRQLKYR